MQKGLLKMEAGPFYIAAIRARNTKRGKLLHNVKVYTKTI